MLGLDMDRLREQQGLARPLVLHVGDFASRDALPANIRNEPLVPKEKGSPTVPFNLPNFALNSLSVRAFNYGYYAIHRNQNQALVVV